MDDESKAPANMSAKDIENNPLSATSDNNSAKQMESSCPVVHQNTKGTGTSIRCSPSKECMDTKEENEGLDSLESVDVAGNNSGITG